MELINVCRCCCSGDGLNKDIFTCYYFMNNKEIYADMLNECFNISLSMSPVVSNNICDSCISCLRSALSFRQQVLRAETAIMEQMTNGVKDDIFVKCEPLEVVYSDDNSSDDYTLADTIKMELELEDSSRPKTRRSTKSSSVSSSTDCGLKAGNNASVASLEDETGSNAPRAPINLPCENRPRITVKRRGQRGVLTLPSAQHQNKDKVKWVKKKEPRKIKININVNKEDKQPEDSSLLLSLSADVKTEEDKSESVTEKRTLRKNLKTARTDRKPYSKTTEAKIMERRTLRSNLETILKYSNVTPFSKACRPTGYSCVFCKLDFPNGEDLRTHVQSYHQKDKSIFGKAFGHEYSAKLDIDNLKCTICDQEMNGLSDLIKHLVNIHKKPYDTSAKDRIVPFNLDRINGLLECVLCPSSYETFMMLSQHMNTHYKNFICDVCGAAFVTKMSKDYHDKSHEVGSYQCKSCDKAFNSKVRYQCHSRMHLKPSKVRCPECTETFPNYYARNRHMVDVHNKEAQYTCKVCNRQFLLKTKLNRHIKKHHLMEKNVPCGVCGMKFFDSYMLKGHMVKHTGEKNYQCDVCMKAFGRRFTLREHMRIHLNERRFKCDYCQQTFVQKCSLRGHLLSNHGISMNACDISPMDKSDMIACAQSAS